jgi:UDP-N-acetylmuramyl pentapeptide phosphotransferase/UDP-N-acetylglucosamine-1-phosphate transferase
MVISIVAGPRFISYLQKKEYGQPIREEGPPRPGTAVSRARRRWAAC